MGLLAGPNIAKILIGYCNNIAKMKISDIGEMQLIKKISKNIRIYSKDVIKGIGDDAAVINFDKNSYMLITTDSLVEDVHFTLDFFNAEQIGKKAIESNVSDIAAMGGFPKYALVSLILPKNIDLSFIGKLYLGLDKSSKKYRLSLIGGNIAHGKEISVSITMVGFVEKKNLCLRSNAKPNDFIAVTGKLGNSKAGLELLKAKKTGKSVDYLLNPEASLNEARLLAKIGVNAMEDVSDGLASEIINICNESKAGAVIYKEKIPLEKSMANDAKKLKKRPLDFALYGGEDYGIVFTISQSQLRKLNNAKNKKIKNKIQQNNNKNTKLDFAIIGRILPEKKGIYLLGKGKKIKLRHGYEHF